MTAQDAETAGNKIKKNGRNHSGKKKRVGTEQNVTVRRTSHQRKKTRMYICLKSIYYDAVQESEEAKTTNEINTRIKEKKKRTSVVRRRWTTDGGRGGDAYAGQCPSETIVALIGVVGIIFKLI